MKNHTQTGLITESKAIKKYIDRLRSLCGVTQSDFIQLYEVAIQRWMDYQQVPDQAVDENKLTSWLDQVILALKKRQGYLLPLSSDSETAFREREEWTYAVFSAALLESFDSVIRLALAKALLPKQAYAWLYRNQRLFSEWQSFLKGSAQQTVFHELLLSSVISPENALTEVKREPLVTQELLPVAVAENEPDKPISAVLPVVTSEKTQQEKPNFTEIKSIDLTELKSRSNRPDGKDKTDRETEVKQSEMSSPQENEPVPILAVSDFWRWLKQAVTRNHISVNENNSVVHGTADGLFIVLPQAIEAFIQHMAQQQGLDNLNGLLKQQAPLMRAIKKQTLLIRKSNGSRIHVYCMGRWEARNTLSGVVINASAFLGELFDLPINANLVRDPLDHGR